MHFLSQIIDIVCEDIAQTQVSDRKYGGAFKFNRNKSPDILGRGVFSDVLNDPADPHMVQKQSNRPLGDQHSQPADGFDFYIRTLVQNNLMDNIHFPKVYKADKNTDATGTHRNKYTMERLEELSAITKEEFQSLIETHMSRPVYNPNQLADRIESCCRSATERSTYLKMDSLIEACETIDEISDIADFRMDIHAGNLMARRTPYGLQLVITDPFGYSTSRRKSAAAH